MSLLSVNNFVAPLRNTTHMITLILVAGLFGAYRYSGGAVSSSRSNSLYSGRSATAVLDEDTSDYSDDDIVSDRGSKAAAPTSTRSGNTNRRLVDELMEDKKNKNDGSKELKSTLDDIEKKLGLR